MSTFVDPLMSTFVDPLMSKFDNLELLGILLHWCNPTSYMKGSNLHVLEVYAEKSEMH